MSQEDDPHAEVFKALYKDRVKCHAMLFRHRHTNEVPEFHREMILGWHGPERAICFMAFRGGAKSTIGEEAVAIMAGFREFRNCLIIGATEERAQDRLRAIRHEMESNDRYREVFGNLIGDLWGEDKLLTSTGIMIQAFGRGQALRGVKHLDQRPDLYFLDDVEDRASTSSPEGRRKAMTWLTTELLPACDPQARGRMAATPMDAEAIPMVLAKDPNSGWRVPVYPIEYKDVVTGERRPTWGDRFPLSEIDRIEANYRAIGEHRAYAQEYLCIASPLEDKPFRAEMFRSEPQTRTWQAVYAMFDPARTTRESSATTGMACWSWIGPKLVIWDAWGRRLMPDEIVKAIFNLNETHHPTWIGVEEDGLNEFLMQPIRQEQVRRGAMAPIKALKAPKGKFDFIRGLQPFFNAREVIFASEVPDLRSQLLSFPTGHIDAPNALAYALKMRPGAPVYDDFGAQHIGEDLRPSSARYPYLCLNASKNTLTGALVQVIDGTIRVYADWVREGEPASLLHDMVGEANLAAGRAVRLLVGPHHFSQYDNVGLVAAIRRLPMSIDTGAPPEMGRDYARGLMKREARGLAAFLVSSDALWTLNGLAGGYARAMVKGGVLADYAEEGPYRLLLEGIESFVGLLKVGSPDDERDDIRYATTADGRRYVSALPGNRR